MSKTLTIPEKIDRYEVLQLLGKGGMGQVFLVRDTTLDRTVALKLLHPAAEHDADTLRRFRLEFQAVAKLRHPNVIALYDWGSYEGQSFFTMEYIDGFTVNEYMGISGGRNVPSLAELNDPSRLRRLIQVLCQTAAALDYVHSHKIIHRDLKPANIMIDQEGHARVMDFGLLKRLDDNDDEDLNELTRPGIILGTPAYLSPEQALGDKAGPQSDLYSLGIILYEMLTGHRPFVSNRVGALIYCQIYETPTPLRQYNPEVPEDFEPIVDRLLRKEPSERYPTAADAMRALLAVRIGDSDERSQVLRLRATPEAEFEGQEAVSYLVEPRFVGRQEPMNAMLAMLGRLRKGLGDMVEITGESGIGKTRFIQELSRFAKLQKVRVFTGTTNEGEVVPYEGIRQVLEEFVKLVSQKGADLAEKVFGLDGQVLAQEIPAFARLEYVKRLPPLSPLPPEQSKYRLFDAIAKVLDKLSRRFPIVLAIEHVQWADRITLELLSYIARNVIAPSRQPRGALGALLLLVTYRDDEEDVSGRLRPIFHALRDQNLLHPVALERFSRAQCADLISSMIHGSELPVGLLDAVFEESGGNPFLAVELVRHWHEGGQLAQKNGIWSFTPPAKESEAQGMELRIAPGIRRAFERRLSGLSPGACRVAEVVAVIGVDASFDVLKEITGLGEDDLFDGLDEAIKRGVMRAVGEAGDGFGFVHPLYGQMIEHKLGPAERQKLHLKAGRTLERMHISDLATYADRLGRHFREAGSRQEAAQYEVMAGDKLKGLFLFEPALEHYGQTMLICEQGAAARERWVIPLLSRAYRSRGEVYQVLGDYPKSEADFESLLRLARASGQKKMAALAHQQLGVIQAGRGASSDAYQHYQQATALFAEIEDNAGVADMLLYLGVFISVQGRYKEATEYLEGALQIKESINDQPGVAAMLNTLGMLHTEQDRFEEALWCIQRSLNLRRQLGDRLGLAVNLNNLGYAHASRGFFEKALRHYEESLSVSREIGDRKGVAQTLNNLAQVYTSLGDLMQAERSSREALQIFRELGLQLEISAALANLAIVTTQHASYDQALVHAVESLGIRRKLGFQVGIVEGLKILAEIYLSLGDPLKAQGYCREAGEVQSTFGVRGPVAEIGWIEGRIWSVQGYKPEARQVFQEALKKADETGERLAELNLKLALCALNLEQENMEEAWEAASEVLATATEAGFRSLVVRANCFLGQAEIDAGQLHPAIERFDQTVAEASKLGLTEELIRSWRLRSKACLAVGDATEALLSLERAVDLADKIRKALYGGIRDSFLERKDIREAVRGYSSLMKLAGEKEEAARVLELFALPKRANRDDELEDTEEITAI